MTREQDVFLAADRAVNASIQQIGEDQWGMALPEWFPLMSTADRSQYDLRHIVNTLAYDEAWVPLSLSGSAPDDPAGPSNTDDLLGADPKISFAVLHQGADAAVSRLEDPAQIVRFSYGDYPAHEALTHLTSFRGFRAWDIAKMIGADTTLPDDLVQGLWDQLSPHFDEWRAIGVFPAALPIPDDASPQDRLLLSVGRQP